MTSDESDRLSVLLFNSHDNPGAGTAGKRILDGLRRLDVDAKMYVQHKSGLNPHVFGPEGKLRKGLVKLRPLLDSLPLKLYGQTRGTFSLGWLPDTLNRRVDEYDPDVVHMNWMGSGFMNVKTPGRIDRPVVWRCPDMWPMTGGCHYNYGCDGFTDACGQCPQLDSKRARDITWWTLRNKKSAWAGADITAVTPSSWLASQAERSSVFGDLRIETIPNGLDTDVYKPTETAAGREIFDLPEDKRLVLFGARNPFGDPRKGYDLLEDALRRIAEDGQRDDLHFVVFGTDTAENVPDVGIDTSCVGYLRDDESLAVLYSAADVMVVPSRYEGFGQTASEALSCGTPVVAFDATGPSDIVDHRETGYLADPYDSASLADGIRWVLADPDRTRDLASAAREKAEETYALDVVARQYVDLYRDLC